MRFIPSGPDVPDALIRAVSDGDVVFLCGAGVSMGCGMPSFETLTKRVYQDLVESSTNEFAEQQAFDRGEFDRALRSLEKRTLLPRSPSRVRLSVAAQLAFKVGMDLANHLTLLQLSRDREGRPKLLTTNFDPLFERAARVAGMSIPSASGKSIPKPGSEHDHGILHLHGRISDVDLGLPATDLILTSADFGDAYLRDGWASQYIEDRMRLNTLVLVGYRAEDAALRLLLETLDADRARFPDLKPIYAIEKSSPGSASIWNAKGIIPVEFPDYPAIYETLAEWAQYAMQPAAYGAARMRSILTGTP